ncbi:response regulator transcription factor [Anaerocolumna xylanovorans]|uniref:Stage 0 sporulation protein A homolog n=1 Tax=Anaerocolumna xylanovorans DSM 12503 TaxID=1121345 RepID=A0A1M7Y4W2_9FIRM|nr:response regulator [Anaerocolumna xylanovorans]SHO47236.1 two-component system, response regulator YesN [Anaerocolumna xylanovorans DSM 12503]
MTVLIVDDQTIVVSGILFGVDWNKLKVNRTLKAYNAYEAKKILKEYQVDIMLCDIEMPAENGLSLYAWTKEQNMDLECIFLTAHADFMYAKEAIRLGSFEYILQPARYEEVENVILRAMEKIRVKRKKTEYSSYGKTLYEKKDVLLEGFLKEVFLGTGQDVETSCQTLETLGVRLKTGKLGYACLVHIQRWSMAIDSWESQLLRYTMNNIVSELFSYYGQKILLLQMDRENYVFAVYTEEINEMEEEAVYRQLSQLIEVYDKYFLCRIACYFTGCQEVGELSVCIKSLIKQREDNVALLSRVFVPDKAGRITENEEMKQNLCAGLEELLLNGAAESLQKEAFLILDRIYAEEGLGGDFLRRFYHEFMQLIYTVSDRLGIKPSHIFENQEVLKRSLTAYTSVEEMKWLVWYVAAFFNEALTSDEKQKNQIDTMLQYIRSNLDKDIRRGDIANLVFLNQNYVSRLFKNEMGVSLKEYIILEKMKLAQALLKSTNMSISMIASKVGYTNFSHFSQTYKKIMGAAPMDDRLRGDTK